MKKPYSPAKYRVVLVTCIEGEEPKYRKTLHRGQTRETAFIHFNKLKKENNKIHFKRNFINSNGIRKVNYQICISKITEDDDIPRILRDPFGKLYTEKFLGDWTIIHSDEYFIEETFWIYGDYPRTDRHGIDAILKKIMIGAHAKKMVKQIIVVWNKLIIFNENQFDLVICKNIEDAQRLHHAISNICKKQKIKSLLFMGTSTKANRGFYYDLIHDKTGWPYTKIRKTSTRP